eukprot:SAG22_NODE_2157_length_2918_cov_4.251153_1_plen_154_part_00
MATLFFSLVVSSLLSVSLAAFSVPVFCCFSSRLLHLSDSGTEHLLSCPPTQLFPNTTSWFPQLLSEFGVGDYGLAPNRQNWPQPRGRAGKVPTIGADDGEDAGKVVVLGQKMRLRAGNGSISWQLDEVRAAAASTTSSIPSYSLPFRTVCLFR